MAKLNQQEAERAWSKWFTGARDRGGQIASMDRIQPRPTLEALRKLRNCSFITLKCCCEKVEKSFFYNAVHLLGTAYYYDAVFYGYV